MESFLFLTILSFERKGCSNKFRVFFIWWATPEESIECTPSPPPLFNWIYYSLCLLRYTKKKGKMAVATGSPSLRGCIIRLLFPRNRSVPVYSGKEKSFPYQSSVKLWHQWLVTEVPAGVLIRGKFNLKIGLWKRCDRNLGEFPTPSTLWAPGMTSWQKIIEFSYKLDLTRSRTKSPQSLPDLLILQSIHTSPLILLGTCRLYFVGRMPVVPLGSAASTRLRYAWVLEQLQSE